MRVFIRSVLASSLLLVAGCDSGFQAMESTEHGVVFSALPPFLGGGVRNKILPPSAKEFILPWETLYRLDTGIQSVSWGAVGRGDQKEIEDFVQTRALDGNEVNLSMTVRFRIIPEKLPYIIQYVGKDNERVAKIVATIAKADVRTHMNTLRTEDFFNRSKLQIAVERVREALNARLRPEGVEVESVLYDSHLFARRLADGTLDTSYQDQINATERKKQETLQELARNATVEEEMKQKYAAAEGEFNQLKERADGELRQARERGDTKFAALAKDAERVFHVGMAEVEGMKKSIEAMSGPGGAALLRLEVVKALIASNPKFVVLNSQGNANGVDLNKLDTNDLIRQLGLFAATAEGLKPAVKGEGTKLPITVGPGSPE